jgi:hypothetical protein
MWNAMPQTPKPAPAKRCPSCGRVAYREVDPDNAKRWIYCCSNKSCEFEQAA